MRCEECEEEKNQLKARKTAAEGQKYKYKLCGKVYTLKPKKGIIEVIMIK